MPHYVEEDYPEGMVSCSYEYDPPHQGMSQNELCVTNQTQIIPGGAVDCSELVAGARLRLHRVLVDIHDKYQLEAELPTPKTRRDRVSAVP